MDLRQNPAITFLAVFTSELRNALSPLAEEHFVAELSSRHDAYVMYTEVRLSPREGGDFRIARFKLEGLEFEVTLIQDHPTPEIAKVFGLKVSVLTEESKIADTAQECAKLAFSWLAYATVPEADELKAKIAFAGLAPSDLQ
jgi:hypothetical protein